MLIKNLNPWREKFITKLLGLVYRLDNSGNARFEQNGEKNFIDQITDYYKGTPFTLFDIGANLGEYTQLILDKRENISLSYCHLFEPQKSCAVKLRERFAGNKKVSVNNFGLSNKNEEALIYKDEEMGGLTSLYKRNLDFYHLKMEQEEKIELVCGKDYIEKNNIRKINLLKIDVEGHELKVFEGLDQYLNSDFIDFIQFEYGGANLDAHTNLLDFYNLLIPRGFVICKIMPKYLEIRDYNPRFDNFVNQNYVAISAKICHNLWICLEN